MPHRTKFYPLTPHGGGGSNLPADREIFRAEPKKREERS